jgi:hypothetical protein
VVFGKRRVSRGWGEGFSWFDVLQELFVGIDSESLQASGSDHGREGFQLREPFGEGQLEQGLGSKTPDLIEESKFALEERNFREEEVRERDG